MADTDLSFDIAPRRREPITFHLGRTPKQAEGDEPYVYTFTPPKVAVLMLPLVATESDFGAMRGTVDWFKAGLPDADWAHLEGRLKDEEDDFDIEDLTKVVRGLNEKISARPTT